MTPAAPTDMFHGTFWAVFLAIAILGIAIWLAIFEHDFHPRIYGYNEEATILQVGGSELEFNHAEGMFTIWWQSGERNVRVWPK